MPTFRNWDHEDLVDLVAILTTDGNSQPETAAALGISQASVSRLMREAQRKGVLVMAQPRCVLQTPRVEELRERVQSPLAVLLRELSPHLHEVHIVRVEEALSEANEGEQVSIRRFREFGSRAASYILRMLGHARTCGVTWGRTVHAVIEGLRERAAGPIRKTCPVKFVPMCGDPTLNVLRDARRSSSHLVADIHEIVNSMSSAAMSLEGVAAYIPQEFKGDTLEVIRAFLESFPSYQQVFGRKAKRGVEARRGVADELDSVLTSVGPALLGDPWFQAAALDIDAEKKLAKLSAGNIGGVFVARHSGEGKNMWVERINERWTGCRIEHFERCARMARTTPERDGVTVAAIGSEKAEIVERCVRLGVVNRLIIDQTLARSLRQSVGTERADGR